MNSSDTKSFGQKNRQTIPLEADIVAHEEFPGLEQLLPPPKKYERKSSTTTSLDVKDSRSWTIEISICKPHRILYVSNEVSDLLEYPSHKICNRSISILQGPNTDILNLHSSFKSALMSVPSIVCIILYSSSGKEQELTAECSAHNLDTPAGFIRLHLLSPGNIGESSGKKPSPTGALDHHLRRQFQRQYRFLAGLAIHQSVVRSAMA